MSEEGGRPISTIFMLHEGLSRLIITVTFFLSIVFIVSDYRPPPPPPKYAQWRDISCDFRSTLAVRISKVIQVTDLISHQHDSYPLIIEIHTRRNVYYTSLNLYMQT